VLERRHLPSNRERPGPEPSDTSAADVPERPDRFPDLLAFDLATGVRLVAGE